MPLFCDAGKKELQADMERLQLVRERRAAAEKKMLEEHGYNIFKEKPPPGVSVKPPAKAYSSDDEDEE